MNAKDCEVSKDFLIFLLGMEGKRKKEKGKQTKNKTKKEEEFMRANEEMYTRSTRYLKLLTTENREAAIETFTGYLTLVFRCMQKTSRVPVLPGLTENVWIRRKPNGKH